MPTGGASPETTVPPWLAARRARTAELSEATASNSNGDSDSDSEPEIEFASIPDEPLPATPESEPVSELAVAVDERSPEPPVLVFKEPSKRPELPDLLPQLLPRSAAIDARDRPATLKNVMPVAITPGESAPEDDNSFKGMVLEWIYSSAATGVMISFCVHSVLLGILAILMISNPHLRRSLDIFGEMGDENQEVAELELDSLEAVDPGQEAAPLEFADVTQMISVEKAAFDPSDTIQGLPGGTGQGNGDGSGVGDAIAVPAIKVPGYAVTKGSFSAWTEPRDPMPTVSYEIVIQFRLPDKVNTYRGSDLTGMVIGTDGYKQVIRFKRDETFTVVDGIVQVRIRVPGADRLVRDTIRVESKVLREKQTIEIEF